MWRIRQGAWVGAAVAIGAIAPASGSVITSVNTGAGGGGLTVTSGSVSTPNPGNYSGSLTTPNFLTYNETWTSGAVGGASFGVAVGAPTEYRTTLNVTNNTGMIMTGYTLYLGAGTIAQPSPLNWFQFHDHNLFATTSTAGGTYSMPGSSGGLGNWIVWTGWNVAPGSSLTLTCNVLLPLTGVSGSWQILQQPTLVPVPGPGAMALASLAGLVCAGRRRR